MEGGRKKLEGRGQRSEVRDQGREFVLYFSGSAIGGKREVAKSALDGAVGKCEAWFDVAM